VIAFNTRDLIEALALDDVNPDVSQVPRLEVMQTDALCCALVGLSWQKWSALFPVLMSAATGIAITNTIVCKQPHRARHLDEMHGVR
jgi:hypothetical protein